MTISGYVKIDRKIVPFHMVDDVVSLIPMPYNSCVTLFPQESKEKELISGVTINNREILFIGCRYTQRSLGYKAYIYSKSNTGTQSSITHFDAICFTGEAVNVFACPGTVILPENDLDISRQMIPIKLRPWEDINKSFLVKVGRRAATLSIDYYISHNYKYSDPSLGAAIPRLFITFPKPIPVRNVIELYLKVYDFFVFINFRRNIVFDKISLYLRNDREKLEEIAEVHISQRAFAQIYSGTPDKTITLFDCEAQLPALFALITNRRKNGVFDDFYIPESSELDKYMTYQSFLSCALSFESEYSRTHPPKESNKERFARAKNLATFSIEQLDSIIQHIQDGNVQKNEIYELFYSLYNTNCSTSAKEFPNSKTRRSFNKYCNQILQSVCNTEYSLAEKFESALIEYDNVVGTAIRRISSFNNTSFPAPELAGREFSQFRNSIAHGEPKEFQNIHRLLYHAARCLIYAIILKQAGFEDEFAGKIISKIF